MPYLHVLLNGKSSRRRPLKPHRPPPAGIGICIAHCISIAFSPSTDALKHSSTDYCQFSSIGSVSIYFLLFLFIFNFFSLRSLSVPTLRSTKLKTPHPGFLQEISKAENVGQDINSKGSTNKECHHRNEIFQHLNNIIRV
ncbi:hypothetical protein I7I48_03478 [Histoplasma ohiense]|nr:hypothetical protein I7I48_03478 [Histoplasma ohiense (nom. inval.)]